MIPGVGRFTSDGRLSSLSPLYTTCRSSRSSVHVAKVTSHTSSGFTQWTRARLIAEPNLLVSGGSTSSGVGDCERRQALIELPQHLSRHPGPGAAGVDQAPIVGVVGEEKGAKLLAEMKAAQS